MRVEVASEFSMIPNNVCIDIQSEGIRIKASVAIKAKDVPIFEAFHKKDGANIDHISTVLPMGFRLIQRICRNHNIRYYLTTVDANGKAALCAAYKADGIRIGAGGGDNALAVFQYVDQHRHKRDKHCHESGLSKRTGSTSTACSRSSGTSSSCLAARKWARATSASTT